MADIPKSDTEPTPQNEYDNANKFFADVEEELIWFKKNQKPLSTGNVGTNIEENRKLMEKHADFCEDKQIHDSQCNKIWKAGRDLLNQEHFTSNVIRIKMGNLRTKWNELTTAANKRTKELHISMKTLHGSHYLQEVEGAVAWIAGKENLVRFPDYGYDIQSADASFLYHFSIYLEIKEFLETFDKLRNSGSVCLVMEDFLLQVGNEDTVRELLQKNESIQLAQAKLEDSFQRLTKRMSTINGNFVTVYMHLKVINAEWSLAESVAFLENRGHRMIFERDQKLAETEMGTKAEADSTSTESTQTLADHMGQTAKGPSQPHPEVVENQEQGSSQGDLLRGSIDCGRKRSVVVGPVPFSHSKIVKLT